MHRQEQVNASHFNEIEVVLNNYFTGLYHADSSVLASVFHPDARYVNTVIGDYMNYSITEYFDIIDRRTPPSANAEARADQIISIELGSPSMAFAKVSMMMLGRSYLDFLTLICDGEQWQILSKVFSYQPNQEQEA